MTVTGTRYSYTQAAAALERAQKSNKGAPAYSRFVNRKLGRYLAAGAYRMGLTPNQVTMISAAFTFSGIALIALVPPSPLLGVAICAALVVGYALDAADGQLSRLLRKSSVAGEWLDHVIDSLKVSSLHLAVLVAVYRHFALPEAFLLVPIGFAAVAAVLFFTSILNDLLRRTKSVPREHEANPSIVRALLVAPTDYGLLCVVFLLFGFAEAFAAVYTLLFLGTAGYLALGLVKWFKDMGALDRAGVDGPPPLRDEESATPVPVGHEIREGLAA